MRKYIVLILAIVTLITFSSCTTSPIKNIGEKLPLNNIKNHTKDILITENVINEMSLDEKIGQMLLVGFDGEYINSDLSEMIQDHYIGGVILFGRNIKNKEQLKALNKNIIKVSQVNKVPIFISTDQEGGRVSRLPGSTYPSNLYMANHNYDLYKVGESIGNEMKNYGFNLDFAPVLDVFSNPKNTVIGDRSFGSDPKLVSSLGISEIKGMMDAGIIPVIKHFPGHGDTYVDSHIGLPIVYKDKETLKRLELIPFQNAMKNGAPVVMVAHIKYPNIDKKYPASLSKEIITNLLRNDLGFNGIVITDDLEMGAIQKNYSVKEAAVQSIKAGADILLFAHSKEKQLEAIDAIKESIEKGEISEERINESLRRILSLKMRYPLMKE